MRIRDIIRCSKNLLLLSKDKTLEVFYGVKKADANSFFSFAWKGLAIFVFVGVFIAGLQTPEVNTILPLHAAADESIVVEKNVDFLSASGSQPFVDGRLIASIEIPDMSAQGSGIGGAIYPTISTAQGISVLSSASPVIPEPPSKDRTKIIEYVVKPYDTPSGIAAAHGLKLNTLLWSNHLTNPNLIQPGDVLFILPLDGLLYEVQNGDTLSRIASRHKADTADILKYNDIQSAQHIFPGQQLIIPGGTEPSGPSSPKSGTSSARPQYASSLPNLDGYFVMPTHGRITQGLHLKSGVDIANKPGTPIYAAASGTVGIAVNNGWWNGGYGNYITISHPNGTHTLYAHLNYGGVAVRSGQYVTQGQFIGSMGNTGLSSGPHVHWEVHGARHPLAGYARGTQI
ncbi:MAG: hypothetical protein A2919_00465 [Candidatus Spechtbacteria bacterium RIFCSPLOWO2_01_FULL_43_12]|uniref:LysM domain-containing protein n=1 Tax=Candidatus Spechtbacteria bacterium RIFCSPLOWO2_01_FULL_43_12 TaxID=1802162 RepID=A0A1G2HER8_9BACT|nr:MAG: hypothetical protein A2919_00465 [Candidatus Spechtbacteria bacterium RIFCSPLOWO2_01_FULL_43_12]